MELSVIPLSLVPLAFASALIRYRLMDVEVIVKRSLDTAVILAIFTIYATLLRLAGTCFSTPRCAQHDHRDARDDRGCAAVQPGEERYPECARPRFYRDKCEYRRALVASRATNSDLDRLSERLVARIRETFVIDRMALLLVNEGSGDYEVIRGEGFGDLTSGPGAIHNSPRAWLAASRCHSTTRGSMARFRSRARVPRGASLFRPVRVEGRDHRLLARPARPGRAVEQRRHGSAGGGRQPRRDGARERPLTASFR
jgi:hypothetical protein